MIATLIIIKTRIRTCACNKAFINVALPSDSISGGHCNLRYCFENTIKSVLCGIVVTDSPDNSSLEAVIPIRCHGMRLDQVAAELFPDYSRSRLSTWIKSGQLLVSGAQVKPRDKAHANDTMVLSVPDAPMIEWQPQSMALDIIYEDEHILVINKPAGLVVHPAAGHADGTLVNALLAHAPELEALPRGGIVHLSLIHI